MSEELKPCPFCGGKAYTDIDDHDNAYTQCEHCGIGTELCADVEYAEEKWNTRASQWVSVDDRLPPEGVRVIAYAPPYGAGSAHIETDTGDWNLHFSLQQIEPSHWQPIAPPKQFNKGLGMRKKSNRQRKLRKCERGVKTKSINKWF